MQSFAEQTDSAAWRLSPDPPIAWVGLLKSAPGRVSGGLAAREFCGRDAGHEIHYTSVARYRRRLGFSMQSNRAPLAGARTLDRGEQFRLVDRQFSSALARGDPAISWKSDTASLLGRPRLPAACAPETAASPPAACARSRTRRCARSATTASSTSRPTRAGSAFRSTPTRGLRRRAGFASGGSTGDVRAGPRVEERAAGPRRRDGPGRPRLSLPSRDVAVEPRRAQALQLQGAVAGPVRGDSPGRGCR